MISYLVVRNRRTNNPERNEQAVQIKIAIEKLGAGGEGLGHFNGKTVFVEDACPGDELLVRVIFEKPNYLKAKIVSIITPSPDRVIPPCKYYYDCGACQIQHMSYQSQIKYKTQIVKETLLHLGGVDPSLVKDMVPADNIWGYRNKMQYPVRKAIGHRPQAERQASRPQAIDGSKDSGVVALGPRSPRNGVHLGYYKKGTHDVIDIDDCMVLHPFLNKAAAAVRKELSRSKIEPYDEDNGRGFMRHVLGRVGFSTKESLLCFVVKEKEFKGSKGLISGLISSLNTSPKECRIENISMNVNSRNTNVILGEFTKTLWGKDDICEQLAGIRLKISPGSFFQVNPQQMRKLYDTVKDFACLNKEQTLLDAYSGTGSIALFLASEAKTVIGIEQVREAVSDARINAKMNGINNAKFILSSTEEALPSITSTGQKIDVVVLDPPRAGCSFSVIREICRMSPGVLVYVSCDPATLARDIKLLSGDFMVTNVVPVDMFPHSSHIETVVKLIRRKR